MKTTWMFTCLVSLFLVSCTSGTKEEKLTIPSDWITLEGEGFSVQCPPEWKLDTATKEGVVMKLLTPADETNDRFSEYVQLTAQELEGKVSLKELAEEMEQMVSFSVSNFEVVENKTYKDDLGQFQKLRGKGSLSIFVVTLENRTRIIGNKGYALLSIYEDKKAMKYRETMDKIAQSLVIK